MNINDMMGLLQQMSKMRNERSDTGVLGGRRMERIPGRLGGSVTNKGGGIAPGGQKPGGSPAIMADINGPSESGQIAENIRAIETEIETARRQLQQAQQRLAQAISTQDQYTAESLRQVISDLRQRIEDLQSQVDQMKEEMNAAEAEENAAASERTSRRTGGGMMGTSSTGGDYGPHRAVNDRAPGWLIGPIGGTGGGGGGTGGGGGGGNPFGWMGQPRRGGALDWAGNPIDGSVSRVSGGKRKRR